MSAAKRDVKHQDTSPALDRPQPTAPKRLIFALLLIGIALFAADSDLRASWPQYVVALLASGIGLLPSVRRRSTTLLEKLRVPSPRAKWLTFAIVFVLCNRYFALSAAHAGRYLSPQFHDEFMYLLQARMLARGRLWMPQHPLADFFDSFFVIVRPIYAAAYFPGTAFFYVPGVWLDLAPWLTAAAISAACVAVLYLLVTETIDGVAGLLSVLLALALPELRGISVMVMSHSALLLLLLLAAWSFTRWRRRHSLAWATAIGFFAGWAAITRPLDAICLILPIDLAMLWDLRQRRAPPQRLALTLALCIAAAAPLFAIQLIFDKGVTGHWLQTPVGLYGRNFPGLGLSLRPSTTLPRESPAALPQVRDYYTQFLRPAFEEHARTSLWATWLGHRLKPAAGAALAAHLLLALVPLGLLSARRRPLNLALAAGIILLPFTYAAFPIYLRHYGLALAPAFIVFILLGANQLTSTFPDLRTALVLALAALSIASLPEVRRKPDTFMQATYLSDINAKLARLEHTPAVVLFQYRSGHADVHEEPVYNIDAAWPDDSPIVWAQDRGPDNQRIYDYYARQQPTRYFYRYERGTGELTPLGWATVLASKHDEK
jgi:4-amino-4-deoxy-L-arabinose transferase-like glycosyltransferase